MKTFYQFLEEKAKKEAMPLIRSVKKKSFGLPLASVMTLNQFYDQEMSVTEALHPLPMADEPPEPKGMLGAKRRILPPEEMEAFLDRVWQRRQESLAKKAQSDKNKKRKELGKPPIKRKKKVVKTDAEKAAEENQRQKDRYTMPYVHGGNIKIIDEKNKRFDLNDLRKMITERPEKFFKKNKKLENSDGSFTKFFNIGLPALKGLAVNEETGDFVVVDTCPGAGVCKTYCYAKNGGYVQWKSSSLSQSRLLNYLLNDPEGFKAQFIQEIASEQRKVSGKNIKLVIRWHDAGDFFSNSYWDLAKSVAAAFPEVTFYAYTKMSSVVLGPMPKNFIINFSGGAAPSQEKQISSSGKEHKHAQVIPEEMFEDLYTQVPNEKMKIAPEKMKILKRRIADKYKIDINTILTYPEYINKKESDIPKWNVIVTTSDGDRSASRHDVIGTYLLLH